MWRRPFGRIERVAAGFASVWLLLAHNGPSASAQSNSATVAVATVRIDANPKHVLNSFDPDRSLGSSIDVLSRPGIDKVYSPHIIEESLSAGWGAITYRNNTELRMAAWHWNENGTWSDPALVNGVTPRSQERVFYRQHRTEGADPLCFGLRATPSGILNQRGSPGARSKPHVLEKQSLPHQQVYR